VVELAVRRLGRWDSNSHRDHTTTSGPVRNPQLSRGIGRGRRLSEASYPAPSGLVCEHCVSMGRPGHLPSAPFSCSDAWPVPGARSTAVVVDLLRPDPAASPSGGPGQTGWTPGPRVRGVDRGTRAGEPPEPVDGRGHLLGCHRPSRDHTIAELATCEDRPLALEIVETQEGTPEAS
jgi:hypothetical protein